MTAINHRPQRRRIGTAAAVTIFVFALALIALTVWLLRLPIQLFIIATLIALAINPAVNWLERRRVPRIVSVIGILIATMGIIASLVTIFLPPLVRQTVDFFNHLPGYFDDLQARLQEATRNFPLLRDRLGEVNFYDELSKRLAGLAMSGYSFARDVAGGVVLSILLLITIVYMLANPAPLYRGLMGVVPEPWAEQARHVVGLMANRVRAWLRGVVILGVIVGVTTGTGLALLGVPYAVVFGVLAGILEVIPTVGPVLSAVPPILVALAGEPIKALWVLLLFVGIQQLENMVLVPLVMRRQLQLHPVSTIFGFISLGTLFGLFGAIVAVPTVACLKVLYEEVYYPWAHPPRPAEPAPESVPESASPQHPAPES